MGQHKPCCCIKFGAWIYPVRNNAPLSFESRYSRDFKMANNFTFKATVVKCAREVSGIFDIMDPLFESL